MSFSVGKASFSRRPLTQTREEYRDPYMSLPEIQDIVRLFPASLPFISNRDLAMDLITLYHQGALTTEMFTQPYESTKDLLFHLPSSREHMATQEVQMALLNDDTGAINDEKHPCRKCGGTLTKGSSKQTRGMDEGTTYFLTCVRCGNRWTVT